MSNYDLNSKDIRKKTIKLSVSVFLSLFFTAIISIVTYMSISFIVTSINTKQIGIRTYEVGENGSKTLITEEYYDDNSSKPSSTTSKVTTGTSDSHVTTDSQQTTSTTTATNLRKEPIRTKLSSSALMLQDIISQILMFIMLISIPYSKLWMQGDKDSNTVNFGHMQKDGLRGLKVGLIASIPSFAAFVFLMLSKLELFWESYISLYRYFNLSFIPIYYAVVGRNTIGASDLSWLAVFVMLLTLFVVPLICHFGYNLGYKHISIREKIVYTNPDKKKKNRR